MYIPSSYVVKAYGNRPEGKYRTCVCIPLSICTYVFLMCRFLLKYVIKPKEIEQKVHWWLMCRILLKYVFKYVEKAYGNRPERARQNLCVYSSFNMYWKLNKIDQEIIKNSCLYSFFTMQYKLMEIDQKGHIENSCVWFSLNMYEQLMQIE